MRLGGKEVYLNCGVNCYSLTGKSFAVISCIKFSRSTVDSIKQNKTLGFTVTGQITAGIFFRSQDAMCSSGAKCNDFIASCCEGDQWLYRSSVSEVNTCRGIIVDSVTQHWVKRENLQQSKRINRHR